MTNQVKQGPGIAHALVYDGALSKDTAGTLQEVHEDLKAIREGNGLAHALLYGDDPSQHAMANLNAMSDDLRAITAGLRQGKGTLGALLVDPTVYEDIKSVVGNVERNEVLRALVRYSIKADEQRPPPGGLRPPVRRGRSRGGRRAGPQGARRRGPGCTTRARSSPGASPSDAGRSSSRLAKKPCAGVWPMRLEACAPRASCRPQGAPTVSTPCSGQVP